METELAWAAGLFEGEGCRTSSRGRPRLQIKMVEEESVRRVAAILGGRVYGPYGPYKSQLGSRPTFLWVAEGAVMEVAIEKIAPYLSSWSRERILSPRGKS